MIGDKQRQPGGIRRGWRIKYGAWKAKNSALYIATQKLMHGILARSFKIVFKPIDADSKERKK